MGCTSDSKSSLEMMLHRSLAQDDGRGLSEPVTDGSTTSTTHWILYDTIAESELRRRKLALMLEHPLKSLFTTYSNSFEDWTSSYSLLYAPLKSSSGK
jgi:hypothetical protein